jgi:hypothetical protein
MGLKREGTVLLKKETRHSLCLCVAARKNNRIGSAPFCQAPNNACGGQTAAPLNIPVFWDMTMDQHFGEAFCLHLQSKFEDVCGKLYLAQNIHRISSAGIQRPCNMYVTA